MIVEKIDLYNYFKATKPVGAVGILTVYAVNQPEHKGRLHPAVLIMPGGGYSTVSFREGEPVALEFLHKGFNAFTLEYSVMPLSFPTQVREAAMAMVFLRENASKYAVDVNMVTAIGFSAGGHLCASLCNLYSDPRVLQIFSDKQQQLIRPNASVLSYSVITSDDKFAHYGSIEYVSGGDKQLKEYLSLEHRVTPNTPPTFLWHTFNDDCVPCENSLMYAQKLKENNVPCELHIFQRGTHGISTANKNCDMFENLDIERKNTQKWVELCLNFLELNNIYLKK